MKTELSAGAPTAASRRARGVRRSGCGHDGPDAVPRDAVAALSLGHIALRLGQIVHRESPAADGDDIAQDCLRRLENPIADPAACGRELLGSRRAIVPEKMTSAVRLAHLMARELIDHPRIFKGGTAR
ncbi:hypothetical protein [Pseudogemmobacter sonorensis]|uniref:hypothetical protein n=1 Tax=Pseudogemmobacter sonorensis TaxID=2989681 RepID=UPI00368C7E43